MESLRAIMDCPEGAEGSENRATSNRRQHGRLKTLDVSSTLGKVLDLSRSGLRIRRSGKTNIKLGDTLTLDVEAAGDVYTLPVEVVRLQKTGFRATDIGLRFRELTEAQQRGLVFLAHMATKSTTPGVNNPHA